MAVVLPPSPGIGREASDLGAGVPVKDGGIDFLSLLVEVNG